MKVYKEPPSFISQNAVLIVLDPEDFKELKKSGRVVGQFTPDDASTESIPVVVELED